MEYLDNFWGPELALGWPEGLRFLVDEGFDVQRALHMAARLGDVKSAEILLSTNGLIVNPRNTFMPLTYEWLIAILAKIDNDVFRMYAEEVWRRVSELQTLALPHLEEDEIDDMALHESSSWIGNNELVQFLSQRMNMTPKYAEALLALPHYILAFTVGDERARVHQTLYEVGWTNIDAGYEYGRTPLIEICRRKLPYTNHEYNCIFVH